MSQVSLSDIVSLAKRRGFVYPGSEIYGGLANTYDYGPLGVELLRNIKNLWWKHFVTDREEIYGLDSCILMSPKVWESSGHTASFTDALIDCKSCNNRTRADHLIEDYIASHKDKLLNNLPQMFDNNWGYAKTTDVSKEIEKILKHGKVEGLSEEQLNFFINWLKIPCPQCGNFNWTKARKFNLLFETHVGILPEKKSLAYLRGEIAQGMFVNFKQVLDSMRPRLPFGLAQQGAAFRNEITLGNFVFRTLQFNLAEFEYFFDPEKTKWEELYAYWEKQMWSWATDWLGIKEKSLRWRTHTDEERSHYSKMTKDIDYKFPFGYKELYGFAYRTDFDLKNHMEKSGVDLRYTDPDDPGRKFIPHVVEPSFGMDRSFLAVMCDAYELVKDKGKQRLVLKLKPALAPYKVAVFPLLANKPDLVNTARKVFDLLKGKFPAAWDDRGNIGKRYFAQDEIGTPWCVTIDFDTLKSQTVTVRDRDTAKQERVAIDRLVEYFETKLGL